MLQNNYKNVFNFHKLFDNTPVVILVYYNNFYDTDDR